MSSHFAPDRSGSARSECLAALGGLIERADRGQLAEAQAAIIQYALASPDLASRSRDMAGLQADLATRMQAAGLNPIQTAYYGVVDAMIDRTRDAVLRQP